MTPDPYFLKSLVTDNALVISGIAEQYFAMSPEFSHPADPRINPMNGVYIWRCLITVALIALTLRVVIVLFGPWAEGDALVYADVARNILHNGCVSVDKAVSLRCNPHWGGNQLPGYPAFLAATWFLFGENMTAPLLVQSLGF